MNLTLPEKDNEQKRLQEWNNWLKNFEAQNLDDNQKPKFEYIPNAAWLLNDLYWNLAEQYVRPQLSNDATEESHKIHPYKIIAASEIAIMMTLPIQLKDTKEEKRINAYLALFVANQILEGWVVGANKEISAKEIELISKFKEPIDKDKVYPESFAAEHVKWLSFLNVTIEKPLLLLAQCWRLYYMSCFALAHPTEMK